MLQHHVNTLDFLTEKSIDDRFGFLNGLTHLPHDSPFKFLLKLTPILIAHVSSKCIEEWLKIVLFQCVNIHKFFHSSFEKIDKLLPGKHPPCYFVSFAFDHK